MLRTRIPLVLAARLIVPVVPAATPTVTVELAIEPAMPRVRLPCLMVVLPVYVLALVNESVPVPDLVREPLPLATPEYVVDALLPPTVKAVDPRLKLPPPPSAP